MDSTRTACRCGHHGRLPLTTTTRAPALMVRSRHARQMTNLLGWNVTSTPATDENTREDHFASVGEAIDPLPFTSEQLRQLFEVNQLDYELLCYAQALRASRLAVLAQNSDAELNSQEYREQTDWGTSPQ